MIQIQYYSLLLKQHLRILPSQLQHKKLADKDGGPFHNSYELYSKSRCLHETFDGVINLDLDQLFGCQKSGFSSLFGFFCVMHLILAAAVLLCVCMYIRAEMMVKNRVCVLCGAVLTSPL